MLMRYDVHVNTVGYQIYAKEVRYVQYMLMRYKVYAN